MIDYFDNFVILAYRDTIIYLDVSEAKIEIQEQSDKPVSINVDESKIRKLDLSTTYKMISIQSIGKAGAICSITLENRTTREIRFVRVVADNSKDQLNFVQLGILVNHSRMTVSPLIKYRSMGKIDQKTGKRYQVSLALRQNGRIEVYSDFILVNEFYNPQMQCVDIASDFNQFYFLSVIDSHLITPQNADIRNVKF